MLDQIRQAVAEAPSGAVLDAAARALWSGLAAGMVAEVEAAGLSAAIEARRAFLRKPAPKPTGRPAVAAPRPQTLFARARTQQPPDRRKSIERRRRLAASGPLPPALASHFSTAEAAVLRIIADEARGKGMCAVTFDEMAARAGTCRTTARNAIRRARALGLVTVQERRRPGRKNLPNLVSIVSLAWRVWLRLRRPDGPKTIGGKKPAATEMMIKQEETPNRTDVQTKRRADLFQTVLDGKRELMLGETPSTPPVDNCTPVTFPVQSYERKW